MDPRKVTSKKTGEPTWGIVGAFNQLNSLAKLKPGRIIAFSDSSKNGFRQELLATYKQKSGSEYMGQQLKRLTQCLPLMGIPVIGGKEEFPGMEAEDLIAKACQDLKGNVVIVAYDKDLLQLVENTEQTHVYYYNPQKQVLLDPSTLSNYIKTQFKWPVGRELSAADLAVYLAVTGDKTDGIKSVGGIGEVTLAQYYADLPENLNNAEKIEALAAIDAKKRAEKNQAVTADWKRGLVNLRVSDLKTQHQHNLNLGPMPTVKADKEAFKQVLEDLTMGAFLAKFDNWFAPFEQAPQPSLDIE
jgi:5'-3' exonuclease